MLIFNVIQILLLSILGFASLYIFIFSVAGHFYRNLKAGKVGCHRRMAVLIPGYKEDDVILQVAKEALNQDYPSEMYDVVIIADSFDPSTIDALRLLPVKLIEVSFDKSTKSKSLNKALSILDDYYEIAVILDADNIMSKDFLTKINAAFEQDYIAVQGHRTAKNQNTSLAVLDAISEEINNHLFRKGHRALGLSSAIIGSGMAFRYGFFKKLMSTVDAVGGFDKEIELKMLKAGYHIAYLDDAIVYDEKVQKAEVFSNQRRRWLSAQFHYFRKDFFSSVKHLVLKGNIDYFDKAIQFIQPPRILLLGAVLMLGTVFCTLNLKFGESSFTVAWGLVMLLCIAAIWLSIPLEFYNSRTLRAIVSLPLGMALMMESLLNIRGANKRFIHTQHNTTHYPVKNR
jgi:cellulose synthase/poly-beta-1,6-N-acetylglucosamine synthase-like glycosyltransferase